MSGKVVAIVGSYRRGGVIDRAVDAILAGAREQGALTSTIYLSERQIEFCTNCRSCTQVAGEGRGKCVQQDGLESILTEVEAADGLVLASAVNYYNATALFRRFLERLVGAYYWPWGQNSPQPRSRQLKRRTVLVASAAMPGFCIPLATGVAKALGLAARSLGARPVGRLWIGLVSGQPHPPLSARTLARARRLGNKLA